MTTFRRIAGQMCSGVKREFLSPNKVRLRLDWGFPYEAFGPNANIKPWHVFNMVESGRALSFNRIPNHPDQEPFLLIQDFYPHYLFFQASVRVNLAKELYDLDLPKTPLTLEKELVYVGRSSMNLHTDVLLRTGQGSGVDSRSDSRSGLLTLASCEVQSVLVDKKTRRPAPYPDWWREKFGKYTSPERQLKVTVQKEPGADSSSLEKDSLKTSATCKTEKISGFPVNQSQPMKQPDSSSTVPIGFITPAANKTENNSASSLNQPQRPIKTLDSSSALPIPDGVTSYKLAVTDSDSDAYGHANWSVYFKYCLDALYMGTLSHGKNSETSTPAHQLKSRAVKSADIAYISEGNVGSDIQVAFWKDLVIPSGVHFSIRDLSSGEPITYAFLQFYSLDDVTLPISDLSQL